MSLYDIPLRTLDGQPGSLADHKARRCSLTARLCGWTGLSD
ncbi:MULTISPECIES: hypothetical protein [Kitasatospora]